MPGRTFRRSIAVLSGMMLFLFCFSAFSQQVKQPNQRHSLWKIQSKTNTVYLLGSVHVLKQDSYPLDDNIEQAYRQSGRLFFEMNLEEAESPRLQQLTMAKGTYRDGTSLKDDLSKQTYELVQKELPELGLSMEQVNRLKPWLLAMTLEMSKLQQLGFDPNQGIDKYFYDKARKNNKKIEGFETGEYQLNLLGEMPARMQEAMLLQILNDVNGVLKEIDSIVEAWKTGDAEELDKFLLKSFRDYPDVYQRLIVNRNKNWLPKIEALVGQKENVMVIVGAAHLVGKDGILAALKRDGFQVEQL